MTWHRHQWEEVRRRFHAPPDNLKRVRAETSEQLDRYMFGVTSVELRCECGRVSEQQFVGDMTARPL